MKRWIGAAAVCGLMAPAFAQQAGSSVQLYGLLYSGVRHLDNVAGGSLTGLATGPSRWGLRGTEDLGGGLSAHFVLESGFDPATGNLRQGGRAFGRQAFVGLSSKAAGNVSFGRQYDPLSAWIAPFTPAGKWNGYMSHVGDTDNLNWSHRINNAVKYTTPDFGGFQAAAMYAFGEQEGSRKENSTRSVGVRYKGHGLSLAAAWRDTYNPSQAVPEGNWNTILFPAVAPDSAASIRAVVPEKMTVAGIGGDYTHGDFKYALSVTQTTYKKVELLGPGMYIGDVKYRNIDANITYSFTPSLQSGLAYVYTTGKVEASGFKPKYHQVNFMTNYFLSKRTILQLGLIHQKAAGGVENAYILFSSTSVSSKNRQNMVLAGIFHFF